MQLLKNSVTVPFLELFDSNGVMPIPRKKKDVLASFGLIGKIHLECIWTESEVQDEIRSVFEDAMDKDDTFPFNFLQVTGTGTKSLIYQRYQHHTNGPLKK